MIYLLRHGETLWNVAGRLQGQSDSPLTWRGIQQARALGESLLRQDRVDGATALISSPQGRAWQTAAIVAEVLGGNPRAIAFDDRLKELDFGAWTGLTFEEVAAAHPEDWARREADKWHVRPPGGESYADVAARARSWLDEQEGGGVRIVVCHGLFGRVLRGLYGGLPAETIFTLDEPQTALFRLNDGRIERIDS